MAISTTMSTGRLLAAHVWFFTLYQVCDCYNGKSAYVSQFQQGTGGEVQNLQSFSETHGNGGEKVMDVVKSHTPTQSFVK